MRFSNPQGRMEGGILTVPFLGKKKNSGKSDSEWGPLLFLDVN